MRHVETLAALGGWDFAAASCGGGVSVGGCQRTLTKKKWLRCAVRRSAFRSIALMGAVATLHHATRQSLQRCDVAVHAAALGILGGRSALRKRR